MKPKHTYLLDGAITILNNVKVNGKDYAIYYGTSKMFQTTNQIYIIDICMLSCIVIYMNYTELIWIYWYVICTWIFRHVNAQWCLQMHLYKPCKSCQMYVWDHFLPTMPMYFDQTSFLTIPTKSGCDDLLITNHFHNHK